MRLPFIHLASVALLVAGLLVGCASSSTSSTISRIDANRAQFDSWPYPVQDAILSERVINGMTPEMVRVAFGEPTEIMTRQTPQGEEETWIYTKGGRRSGSGNRVMSGTNVSIGGGGVYVSGNPANLGGGSAPAPLDEKIVVFRRGVVISSR